MAVPFRSASKTVIFRNFKCRVASSRVANVYRRDAFYHFNIFQNSSKIVYDMYNLRHFQKMSCIFSGRRIALETFIIIVC